ncbi:Putative DNA-invertase from lambdoid prophage Rac [Acinetobacter calcoaceticus]|uniref:DNA-invertase from lambdoid prophage Rac n=1 Tax=Acinetobacter calcoaceticus TaxID=471 RepID=A0A446ZMR6_ACICA|nr:resolvase [Acinetobacter calcoaceticus]VAX45788.1 Putative DNA-invertase from lambdoid prophage Rac [Acinetobacter calcoaceticus]
MRTYAYMRFNSNIYEFDKEKDFFISLLNDFNHIVQYSRVVLELVSVDKSITFRTIFFNLINYSLEEGDFLIVKSIDCLGNCFKEILSTIILIERKKIKLLILDYINSELEGDIKNNLIHFLEICIDFEKLFLSDQTVQKKHSLSKKVGRPEKLTNDQKQEVINKFKEGFSVYSLAKDLAVSRTVIQRIIEKSSE